MLFAAVIIVILRVMRKGKGGQKLPTLKASPKVDLPCKARHCLFNKLLVNICINVQNEPHRVAGTL